MSCFCGGCRDCIAAQGGYEVPTQCGVCDAALPDSNDTGFCSTKCEASYAEAVRREDAALALQLHDEAVLAKIL